MGYTHTRKRPKTGPPTERVVDYDFSGSDNVFIGYNAGQNYVGTLGYPPVDDAPGFWHCAYCGQSNAAEREGCRGCLAPRPEEVDDESVEIRVYGGEDITINIDSLAATSALDAVLSELEGIRVPL